MEIKRELNTDDAKYDIKGLSHEQFTLLLRCYEKQMYVYCNSRPDRETDELLDKMLKMSESSVTIIK